MLAELILRDQEHNDDIYRQAVACIEIDSLSSLCRSGRFDGISTAEAASTAQRQIKVAPTSTTPAGPSILLIDPSSGSSDPKLLLVGYDLHIVCSCCKSEC